MPSKHPKDRNLTRLDTGRTAGWQVRIRRGGETVTKLFSDGVYGGSELARIAAVRWRDEMLTLLPEAPPRTAHLQTPSVRAKSAKSLSRTGVKGIGFTVRTISGGRRVPYVTAHWREPETGRRRSTGYSVFAHGVRGALRLAVRTLREGRGETPTQGQIDYLVRKAFPQIEAAIHQAWLTRDSLE